MRSARRRFRVGRKSSRRYEHPDIAVLLQQSHELTHLLDGGRGATVFDLNLYAGGDCSQRITICDYVDSAVLALWSYELCVIAHASKKRSNQLMKLVWVL